MADHTSVASLSALGLLLDTHKLETLSRQEFGKLFCHIVSMCSYFVNARFESRRSEDTGFIINLSPFIVSLDTLRSLFSCINCVVVAHEIKSEHTYGNVENVRDIMTRVVNTMVIHAPHLLQVWFF